MKKLVGFIFMLVLSLTFSMTTYAADDFEGVIAKVAPDKKKDKNKDKKKKKNKKNKKNKKKSKKAKKGKKKAKKVKKDTQSSLKPSEVVKEILEDYTSKEDENKDLPVVDLKVNSASKIWTNEVDITKVNIEQTLNELLIGEYGYPTAPEIVVALHDKFKERVSGVIEIHTSAGASANYLVQYKTSMNEFRFVSKDSLVYFKCFVERNSNSGSYDLNSFIYVTKYAGIELNIDQKQLDAISKGEATARFKAGNVYWTLTGDYGCIVFSREERKSINLTMDDVFKACAKHRLVFTNSFYSKFLNLINSDLLSTDYDDSAIYEYHKGAKFNFSEVTDGKIGVDFISYSDNAKYKETELQIAGNINIDTRVSELAKILDEYTGIDLYTFDTSRIENMLKGDAIQEFSVDQERDLGDSHICISVANNGEQTFQFSVTFTRKY